MVRVLSRGVRRSSKIPSATSCRIVWALAPAAEGARAFVLADLGGGGSRLSFGKAPQGEGGQEVGDGVDENGPGGADELHETTGRGRADDGNERIAGGKPAVCFHQSALVYQGREDGDCGDLKEDRQCRDRKCDQVKVG